MASRWKHDRPLSRAQFEARFPDDAACAAYLAQKRWPDGFVCPSCGGAKGWALKTKAHTWECAACHRQTSVTAGTILHGSHLPLKVWFTAIHILTSHSNGISALQLQAQLGLGSYKSAWLMLQKLRRAMVNPERSLLEGVVEIDETEMPLRRKDDPPAGEYPLDPPAGPGHDVDEEEAGVDDHEGVDALKEALLSMTDDAVFLEAKLALLFDLSGCCFDIIGVDSGLYR